MDNDLKKIKELSTMTFKEIYDCKNKFNELTDDLMSYRQFIHFLRISKTVLNRFGNSKFIHEFFKMFATSGYLYRFDFLLMIAILRNKVSIFTLKEFLMDFLKKDHIFDGLDDTYLLCIYDNNEVKISDFKKNIYDFEFLFNVFHIEI